MTLNKAAHQAIAKLLQALPSDTPDAEPLFRSRKTGRALTVPTLNNMVKGWCSWCGLHGNYGSYTLRKTFGYHHRVTFGTDLPTLMTVFGHSTESQTLHYLCIQDEEVREAFLREL